MECPVCKNVQLMMSSREGIEIDYCAQCRGVWLDRGELDKIIDRSAGASSTPPATAGQQPAHPQHQQQPPYQPQPAQPYYDPRHGGYHKKKKREGFLSDLFDFD